MNAATPVSRSCLRIASVARGRPPAASQPLRSQSRRELSTSYGRDTRVATLRRLPIPDFLLPLQSRWIGSVMAASLNAQLAAKCKRRFSSTSPRRNTATAVTNPRKDENGDIMTIEITPRASDVSPPPLAPACKANTSPAPESHLRQRL